MFFYIVINRYISIIFEFFCTAFRCVAIAKQDAIVYTNIECRFAKYAEFFMGVLPNTPPKTREV